MDNKTVVTKGELEGLIADAKSQPLVHAETPEQDRITLLLKAHYEQPGQDPVSTGNAFHSYVPASDETPYVRSSKKQKATWEWKGLDFGWLADCPGIVVIENCSHDRMIHVSLCAGDQGFLTIPSGLSYPILCDDPLELRIRCSAGEAVYKITVFPGEQDAS